MKKILAAALSAALVFTAAAPTASLAAENDSNNPSALAEQNQNRTPAFYGAEGGGMWAKGARQALDNGEKIEIYWVTNLNDSGKGSFRDAVSKGNRIIAFDVCGYVDLVKNISINQDNITILGQTAPGDGICFRGDNIKVSANNVILRYVRFRVGAEHADGTVTPARDGLEITDDCQNVIIDHCSVSWGTDENLSSYAVKDVTIQNSIIAEALNQSVHDKGEHSYAAIWGGVNLSVHHNLIASHKSRNPKIGTSETVAMTKGYTDSQTLVDMKNNVFYNWGDKAGYGTENGAKTYIQNNIYRPGPATPVGKRARIFELSVGQKYQTNMFGSVYAKGNIIDVDANDPDYASAQLVNENNWQDDKHTGVYTDTKFYALGDKSHIKIETPNEDYQKYEAEYPVTLDDTKDVYEKVLANAGATLPKRDKVDERIIDNVRNRTAPKGSKGSTGLVDDPRDGVPESANKDSYDDRGYPIFEAADRLTEITDADADGIPDSWEESHGLRSDDPSDSTEIGPEGYTWFEIYVEDEITKSRYINTPAELSVNQTVEYGTDTVISLKNLSSAVTEAEFYCGDKLLGTAAPASGTATLTTKGIDAGTKYITAVAKDKDGNKKVSNTCMVHCYTSSANAEFEGWKGKGAALINGSYVLGPSGELSRTVSGDFDFITEIEDIGSYTGGGDIELSVGSNKISYYGLRSTYAPEAETASEDSYTALDKYKMIKFSRTGNKLKIFMGSSLADWVEITNDISVSDPSVVVTVKNIGNRVDILSLLRVITADMKTAPAISIVNIKENQRLGFSEDMEVKVTPDSKAGISEIYVYLTENGSDTLITNYKAPEAVTEEKTVTIPLKFSGIAKGVLKAICFDNNLGTASDTRNVSVSQEVSPWQLADIGKADSDEKTYVSVTSDYTYKINSSAGSIGGSSDSFGYMYQKFDGDTRVYYRSRMQSGKQFGIVIKNNLDADGVTYYFGGNVQADGKPLYQLMARTAKGTEMKLIKDVTPDIGNSANLYFVAEKAGDSINIYQTENGATIYTTKKLIASVKADGIGSSYYMGFGAVYNADYKEPADAGWVGIEKISDNGISYKWDFDNGLDWMWQMQESNVLKHKYTDEAINGNASGKMLLAPDENYTENRYVFREYIMEDKYLPKLSTDVLLTGESPSLNLYFQTGSADKAFKITFSDNGKIYVNNNDNLAEINGTEIGAWEIGSWYNVEISSVIDETTNFERGCSIKITDKAGNTAGSMDNAPISGSGAFRTQINTAKKTPVTKAVYFEPISTAKGTYYIDNVTIAAKTGRYEVVKTENLFKFDDEADGKLGNKSFENGFETKASLDVTSVKASTISDESFTKRAQMDKGSQSSNAVIIPTGISGGEGSCDIYVYAAQGGSSGERYLVLSDGSKEVTRLLIGAANRFDYTYTGTADKLIAYSTSKIYVYGIKVVKTDIKDNGENPNPTEPSSTEIMSYNPETGVVKVQFGNADKVPGKVTVVVAGYDKNDAVISVTQATTDSNPLNTVEIPTNRIPVNGTTDGAVSCKVFLFDNMDNITPLCNAKEFILPLCIAPSDSPEV